MRGQAAQSVLRRWSDLQRFWLLPQRFASNEELKRVKFERIKLVLGRLIDGFEKIGLHVNGLIVVELFNFDLRGYRLLVIIFLFALSR